MMSINIPSSVTGIGAVAFADCKKLKSITIPKNVTAIEDLTFYDCTSLKNLTIKGQIESIGEESFSHCAFTQIKITAKVREIVESAFSGCRKLKQISVVPENPYYSSEGGILSDKDKTTLLICPRG